MVEETWLYHYDPISQLETEVLLHPGEPTQKKVRQQKSAGKVQLTAFFDWQGMV